jgi:signal peptide peptidase SppA
MKILQKILNSVWAIDKSAADAHIPLLIKLFNNESFQAPSEEIERFSFHNKTGFVVASFGWNIKDIPEDSVAVINLTDVIYKYDMYCGPAGMISIAKTLKRLDNHPNVKGIVLNIDTPGGEGSAAKLMYDTIKSLNKVVVAFIDDMSASAGMYISAACDHIVANNKLALVGSIGTYITIADYTEALEAQGIKLLNVYADDSTLKNSEHIEAIEYIQTNGESGSIDKIKTLVNKFNDDFLANVQEGRGALLKSDTWKSGKLFFAEEALEIGLIDGIDSLDNVIQKFF